jgi:hypothetical protein
MEEQVCRGVRGLRRHFVLLPYLSFEVEMQAFIVLYVLCIILMLS